MALSWSYSLCSASVNEGGITIWIVRNRSPWPPLAAGRPLPFVEAYCQPGSREGP